MPEQSRPPFRADHVGSFLRPTRLQEAMKGAPGPALTALQDECIRDIVAFQEGIGLALVTDGEYRHSSWHNFLEKIEGVTVSRQRPGADGTSKTFSPRGYEVSGKIRHTRGIEVAAFEFLKSVAHVAPKVTMASPTMLLRAGREDISAEIYPDLAEFHADIAALYAAEIAQLAAAGCRYVQLDDTNYAYLCDPDLRDKALPTGGEAPAVTTNRYVQLTNQVLASKPAGMAICVHVCRGNSAGAFAARGGYEPVAEVLLTQLNVDGYFLEYDDERSGGFEPLRFFPKGSAKRVVLGLVSTKNPAVETKDVLKRRIDEAAKYVPLENLCLSPQCGFASVLAGNPITEEVQRAKMTLIAETAREVWGTTA
jgi:5-methyltetrahydropteroyltriglutamate--homocysteine methyltransferase